MSQNAEKNAVLRESLTKYLHEATSEALDAFFAGPRKGDGNAEARFLQQTMIDAVKGKWEPIKETLCAIGVD